MKKIMVAGSLVVIVLLAVWVGRQQREIAQLKIAAEKRAVEKNVQMVPAPGHAQRRESATQMIRAEPGPTPAASAPPLATSTDANKSKPAMANFFANIGPMMTNPAMKEMIRTQTQVSLDKQYDRIFQFLNLPQATIDTLKGILMDRQMSMIDNVMALMTANASPEERTQKAKEFKSVKESYDKEIEQLLGAEDYDTFKQYENTQTERTQVEMFKNSIASSTEPLSEQQESDLVNAMYQARTNSSLAHAMSKQDKLPDASQFAGPKLNQTLGYMDTMQSQYILTAATILSPSQLARFKAVAAQQQEGKRMALKFASQMFGDDKFKAKTPAPGAPSPAP